MYLEFDFDPETGEYTPVKSEIVDQKETKKAASKSTASLDDGTTEPIVTLEDNKYILNGAAARLLGVQPDDRLDVKYEDVGEGKYPVIGSNEAFGTKGGNKLTKSLTVSCRGKANELLALHGNTFNVIPHPSKDGLFILNGGIPPIKSESKDININIEDDSNEDLPLNTSILDMVQDTDNDVKEVTSFDFNQFL